MWGRMTLALVRIFAQVSSPPTDDAEADRCYPGAMSFNGKKAKKVWAIVALLVMVSMLASMAQFGY